ncbi:F-box protein [Rhynchospora pubera]|nr:F-box protein [Rhynchospora pubera]
MRHLTNPDLSLLNPVTNSKVSLPFIQSMGPRLVWASLDPVQTEDYAVCLFGNAWTPKKFSAFLQPGEVKWTIINKGSLESCYYKGMYLHLNTDSNSLEIYDVATRTLREGPVSPIAGLAHLVVSAGQVILVLKYDHMYLPVHQCHFEIHRLEFGTGTDEKKPFWVKISNIGDQILFLNLASGFSISASCFVGVRGNFIYFMKETNNGFDNRISYVLARYDIEAGTAEVLPFPPVTKCGM